MNFRDGAKLAIENSSALLSVAALSANINQFGIASSLTILSAEEAIKALVCLEKAFYPSLEIHDFEKVFKDHKIKHKRITHSLDFTQELVKRTVVAIPALRTRIEQISQQSGESYPEETIQQLHQIVDYMEKISSDPKSFPSSEITKWWEHANNKKNEGLYVGKEHDAWHNPMLVTKDFFLQGAKYAKMLNEHVAFFFGLHLMFELNDVNIK